MNGFAQDAVERFQSILDELVGVFGHLAAMAAIEVRGAGRDVWGHPGSTTAYMTGTWIDADCGAVISTCVSTSVSLPLRPGHEFLYSRQQLFAMALNTAYALAAQ